MCSVALLATPLDGSPARSLVHSIPSTISALSETAYEPSLHPVLASIKDAPPPRAPTPRSIALNARSTTARSLVKIAKSSPLNVLLAFIPIGWALYFAHQNQIAVFVCTFIAIIPLAQLLGFATEELEERVGPTVGGLLNATLGNAVELIVAIIALAQFLGSILSNLLLVLGMCFFCGGTKYADQAFKQMQSQLHSTLLVLSVIAVLLPGAFHFAVQWRNSSDNDASDDIVNTVQSTDILKMSRGVAIILLFIYGCFIYFTLFSHKAMLQVADEGSSTTYESGKGLPINWSRRIRGKFSKAKRNSEVDKEGLRSEDEPEEPKLTLPVTIGLLILVAVLVGVTSEFLVDSIDAVVATGAISEEWVGLILIPIIGNAAEHVSAVTVAVKDKVDLAINIAVGSSIQIAVFLIPFTVVVAWAMGKQLTMLFDPFESLSLFLAVMVVSYCVQDGRSNWLEGMILMCVYVILALCFFFYPGYDPTTFLGITCTA